MKTSSRPDSLNDNNNSMHGVVTDAISTPPFPVAKNARITPELKRWPKSA
jgi:hypothetical protein